MDHQVLQAYLGQKDLLVRNLVFVHLFVMLVKGIVEMLTQKSIFCHYLLIFGAFGAWQYMTIVELSELTE